MSAYKKLNKQDAFITTYAAHKTWTVTGSDFANYGITTKVAGDGYILPNLQQLYYRTKNSDGTITSHSFDNYNQTTLFYSSSRNLTTGSSVISIPRQMYGTAIKPGSFVLTLSVGAVATGKAMAVDYVTVGYVQDTPTIYITDPTGLQKTVGAAGIPGGPAGPVDLATYVFVDDAEGNLYLQGYPTNKVGDIVYTHGMAIVTNLGYINLVASILKGNVAGASVSFQSTQPIYTHNYHCKIRESEYNLTYNPSALSSSIKTVYDNEGNLYSTSSNVSNGVLNSNLTGSLTGSVFQPYITTVGLYNDANQLIAVGKMGQPVPKSVNTEMTIIVKIDI
jgi:hypothetical protein